jgi:cell division protein FtsL
MENFSKLDSSIRNNFVSHINQRWRQLYELEKEWGEKALRYILFINSGGAIATLSFLGASEKAFNLSGAKIALLLFVVGIVFVGISTAKTYHHMSGLFKAYKQDVYQYFNDKITWEHLNDEDSKRAKENRWDYVFPYASFACFIGGCITGAVALCV